MDERTGSCAQSAACLRADRCGQRTVSALQKRRAGQFECAPRGAPAQRRGELCFPLRLFPSPHSLSLSLSEQSCPPCFPASDTTRGEGAPGAGAPLRRAPHCDTEKSRCCLRLPLGPPGPCPGPYKCRGHGSITSHRPHCNPTIPQLSLPSPLQRDSSSSSVNLPT